MEVTHRNVSKLSLDSAKNKQLYQTWYSWEFCTNSLRLVCGTEHLHTQHLAQTEIPEIVCGLVHYLS